MKWSLKVGKVAGIDLYLHITFLLLIAWLIGSHFLVGHTLGAALAGVSFVLLLFGIIVLHELGHALAARRYGIKTRHITLWPIGGVAYLEGMPEQPKQELVVALAGPAVNVGLALLSFGGAAALAGAGEVFNVSFAGGHFLSQMFWINVWLAGFNLLPAFPMDGGRVLRALLAMRMRRARATVAAARVGQAMAVAFGLIGLFSHPILLFIAFFVWIGAEGEAAQVQLESVLGEVRIGEVMIREFSRLNPKVPLSEAARLVSPLSQSVFPVIEGDQVEGLIGLQQIARGLAEAEPYSTVGDLLEKAVVTAEPEELLLPALHRWQDAGTSGIVVMEGPQLVGLVTPAAVNELFSIRSALLASDSTGPSRSDSRMQGSLGRTK